MIVEVALPAGVVEDTESNPAGCMVLDCSLLLGHGPLDCSSLRWP